MICEYFTNVAVRGLVVYKIANLVVVGGGGV